ncbi:hypothetical protein CBR_g36473 [Chara braunii]|uniref:DFDF domain-containing protein n=1 Tax=Chara braunii TaxID=69332 RepID=A0A388LKY6_CHABU|nr:hypothetical protein CBR_g36473 [Chara braunii]|eukprot:GBG82947.1 hypothetical protein CBR_g36473 [Chara braunii]
MADPGVGGGTTADSYIGSHISLTSKSEIRYEGILYTVDTENSNIALQNVRSFGTEGRKQDGPEIPPSDKVYDYIIFRGSDIKDLQVKSSPSQPPKDPAIISMPTRPQYPQSTTLSGAYGTAPGDGATGPTPYPVPPPAFTPMPPLYQPTAWGRPPQAPVNGGMMSTTLYWPNYNYNQPSLQPHPLPAQAQPQPQQTAQQPQLMPPAPNIGAAQPQPPSAPPASTASSVVSSLAVANVPPPSSLSTSSAIASSPAITTSMASLQPSVSIGMGAVPGGAVGGGGGTGVVSLMPAGGGMGGVAIGSNSVPNVVLRPSNDGATAVATPVAKTPRRIPAPVQPNSFQTVPGSSASTSTLSTPSSFSAASSSGTAAALASSPESTQVAKPMQRQGGSGAGPSGGLGKVGPVGSMMQQQPSKGEGKAAEMGKVGTGQHQPSAPAAPGHMPMHGHQGYGQVPQMPLLPLPMSQKQMPNGAAGLPVQGNGIVVVPNHYIGRRGGRARGGGGGGRGVQQQAQQFTEDFDFIAMNERFKKEEVWGELGANLRADDKDKSSDSNAEAAEGSGGSDGAAVASATGNGSSQTGNGTANATANGSARPPLELLKKSYDKDEFFDSISCDALDRESGSHNRPRFSEQRKIDTETFGPIPMRSGRGSGRGGRGSGRRGGFRSGYYGIAAHLHGMHNGGRLIFHHHGRGRAALVARPGNSN